MTALQAYLQSSKTRKVLSKKPGSAGFSLIELVVVVAVLAVLAAIAIPAFTNITESSRTSSAKTALANAAKECAVSRAAGTTAAHTALVDGSGLSFSAGLTGAGCTETTAAACTNGNGSPQSFSVNLATGAKTSGANSATATVQCTGTTGTAW